MPQHDVLAQIRVQFGRDIGVDEAAREIGIALDAAWSDDRKIREVAAVLGVSGGEGDAEETRLREAIRREPKDAHAHINLGHRLQVLRKHADAEASYREAVRLAPKHAYAHTSLACLLDELGKHADSETSHREAIRLDPKYADAHYGLACLLDKLGKDAGAEASYREVIRLDPKGAPAHWALTTLLEKRDDVDGAIVEVREYIRKGGHPGFDGEARLAELLEKKPDGSRFKLALRDGRGIALERDDVDATHGRRAFMMR